MVRALLGDDRVDPPLARLGEAQRQRRDVVGPLHPRPLEAHRRGRAAPASPPAPRADRSCGRTGPRARCASRPRRARRCRACRRRGGRSRRRGAGRPRRRPPPRSTSFRPGCRRGCRRWGRPRRSARHRPCARSPPTASRSGGARRTAPPAARRWRQGPLRRPAIRRPWPSCVRCRARRAPPAPPGAPHAREARDRSQRPPMVIPAMAMDGASTEAEPRRIVRETSRGEHVGEGARHGDLGHRVGDLTVLEPEAGRPARVVAVDDVGAHADEIRHQHARPGLAHQRRQGRPNRPRP